MLTINCPCCQRLLRPPEEGAEQTACCPGCGTTFTVESEDAILRTQAARQEAIQVESLPPSPPPFAENDPGEAPTEEPALVRSVARDVSNDLYRVRTRRIHRAFLAVAAVVIILGSSSDDYFGRGLQRVFGILLCAGFFGALAAAVVAFFNIPNEDLLAPGEEELDRRVSRWRRRRRRRSPSADPNEPPPAVPPSPQEPPHDAVFKPQDPS